MDYPSRRIRRDGEGQMPPHIIFRVSTGGQQAPPMRLRLRVLSVYCFIGVVGLVVMVYWFNGLLGGLVLLVLFTWVIPGLSMDDPWKWIIHK